MTDQEASQYRFSGYQLDLIILDETGPSYAVNCVHPYYKNQPLYWQKGFSYGNSKGSSVIEDVPYNNDTNTQIYPMLPL